MYLHPITTMLAIMRTILTDFEHLARLKAVSIYIYIVAIGIGVTAE